MFKIEVIKQHPRTKARVTKITTPHGEILTPTFMPVGTRAFVNTLTPDDLEETNSQIILGGNTYHMLCTPGLATIEKLGGMHNFMHWHKPMLTDSGGYQVFSLSQNKKICTINEDGAKFKHPKTGQVIFLNPESSIKAQKIIGADIIMAFDQCTEESEDRAKVLAVLEKTHRWLLESKEVHDREPLSAYGYHQALFGIIQGGSFRDLREKSAQFVASLGLDGIAIGGEVIGYNMAKTAEILAWIEPLLPQNKTRYAMGVGLAPQDLLAVTALGVDIFDCVAPTRNARHGALYCGKIVIENNWPKFISDDPSSRILIKKQMYANDERPVMDECNCSTCCNHSRAYLHHLYKENAPLYVNLACIHNIYVMQNVCARIRECVMNQE